MGLVRTQKIGEGMHIKGRGRDINISILKIMGVEFHRSAKFKVEGVEGVSELEICADEGYVDLTGELKMQITNSRDKREGFISVNYDGPKDYKFQRREYEENKKEYPGEIINKNHPVGFYYH